jgi:nitroreductase
MDFFEIIQLRHSVRSFSTEPIELESVQFILEAANRAPSAGNLQGYEIFIATEQVHRSGLVHATRGQEFILQAPLILVFCANPARSAVKYMERGEKLYSIQDATIACTFAMLAASSLSLSTVWVGAFDEKEVNEVLDIPSNLQPVVILPVGHTEKEPRITSRRNLNDLCHFVRA